MYLPLKADVYCSGSFGGTTSHIVLKPKSDEVTHVVVKVSAREDSQRLVPVEYIEGSSAHAIQLGCDLAHLEAMPLFAKTLYSEQDIPIFLSSDARENTQVLALIRHVRREIPVEQIPEGEVALGDHARGQATDGRIGLVVALEIDPSTHRVSDLVLREGVLWGRKTVSIPADAVDFFDENAVYLKWDEERLAKLPPMISPSAEVAAR